MSSKINMPELLAPAGSLEKLKVAAHYGADAVYMGGSRYSLRAHAVLGDDNLAEAVNYAHGKSVKVYVTVNVMAHNRDLDGLPDYLSFLHEIKADGVIISDPGIFSYARKIVPDLPIHLSTQANVTNRASAEFWQRQGALRVNLARELSLAEISEIRKAVGLQLEAFVHGAICISYSGRCSLSLYLTGRDANLGNCAHPCRYKYQLQEEKRPGQFMPVEEDGRGTYIFNSKDLCLLNRLPSLVDAGVDSFKIEGRMKSIYYVGATVRLYRAALNYIEKECAGNYENLNELVLPPVFSEEMCKIGSRGYTENFIDGPPDESQMLYDGIRDKQRFVPVGVVREAGSIPIIEVRSQFSQGDIIDYLETSDLTEKKLKVGGLKDLQGNNLETVNPGNLIKLETHPKVELWQVNGLLRKCLDE